MRASIAGDYAVLDCGDKGRFYFGYEVTRDGDADGDGAEWCFQFKKGSKVVTIGQSALGLEDGLDMGEYLLAGIGKLMEMEVLTA